MESSKKIKKKDAVISPSLPRIDPEMSLSHLSAYYYAYYSNCNCDACQLLRPIAKKLIGSLKKEEAKKIVEGERSG